MLTGKTVLVGITGAIAAYKTIELIRMFKRQNATVQVVVTPNALKFVTETTLQSLSQNKVFVNQYDIDDFKPEHIALADSADVFVIVPCSANTISKLANGICDNLLTSIACAIKKPIIIAPCMNTGMWENSFIQENLKKLKNNGVNIIEPQTGFLACGTQGKGRLASLDIIYEEVQKTLVSKTFLKGKKIVITAGGTKENIDPVRYIGNYSSGKMGIALADIAYSMGADVTLISTVDADKSYNIVKVQTASEMYEKVKIAFENADSLIMAAAVSDYRVENQALQKIKKENQENLTIQLVKNPDILKEMSAIKSEKQVVVGFCAESENLIENAKLKIHKKKCDYIVANDISKSEIGFGAPENEVFVIDKDKNIIHFEKAGKKEIARKIIEEIYGKNV